MNRGGDQEYYRSLIHELCSYTTEVEWVEFKKNNSNPEEIGRYISALANSAALNRKTNGYLLWGIQDKTHDIIGTSFDPETAKKGNEPLENWLLRLLEPKIGFTFHSVVLDDKPIVLLEIERATRVPTSFAGTEYIRIGEVTKSLKDAPDRERKLWRIFDEKPFEDLIAVERLTSDEVLQKLDYPSYFDLLQLPLPPNRDSILEYLEEDELIRKNQAGTWDITNLGAILFAKNLGNFKNLRRKAVRVVQYKGKGRTKTQKEQEEKEGYASGFEGLMSYINGLIPANEVIGKALRREIPMFPDLAIRELVANALIHQDFFIKGAGPMIEIFEDRIEITNPGEPIVDTQRFVDTPPKSRNETLASIMRRFHICEERGSGIDKVVSQVEFFQLPAPLFEVPTGFTRSVLFAHKDLTQMDKTEKVRACYLHACLKWVMKDYLTNASLRERFGIEEKNKATISRYIKETVEKGLIKPYDDTAPRKMMKYVPFWA
ncbi:MAG TPA: ATP-binding protein [Clostridia bacterium]|nr:ATP-binding protein [Clostridia bacterium]